MGSYSESIFKIEGLDYTHLCCAANAMVKLDVSNYDIWRAQWVSLLNGVRLMSMADGSTPPPPKDKWSYDIWHRRDQMLLHAILISVSEVFLKRLNISQVKTAAQAWDQIAKASVFEATEF
ncbi:hypothetical protein CCACVL1_18944 [Corchorus capsularis]|uniref:Retrotransposon Copia-like N-terminal domain-containing protein n=1 Tax=Corchorus capsularis TaxID=210143 RepID=A0A1R3HJB4_COCAP|nr:hypothetical protein CCACVL1_18944 [Corchorus capsularis]